MMKKQLYRLPTIDLDQAVMERLEAYCARVGGVKTAVVRIAIREFLDRAGKDVKGEGDD